MIAKKERSAFTLVDHRTDCLELTSMTLVRARGQRADQTHRNTCHVN